VVLLPAVAVNADRMLVMQLVIRLPSTTGNADATINVSAVTEMAVGDIITGGTSGTTGVITAVGATSVTVDNVDGFFKKTETVSAGDVSTLTITSFA
jgi:hypothetical protein